MRKFFTDFIIAVHAIWTLALLISLPLVIIYNQYYKISLLLVAVTLGFQLLFWGCPLTEMENKLRGNGAYKEKTFMSHYLKAMFGIKVSDRTVDWFTALYFVILILASVLRFWI